MQEISPYQEVALKWLTLHRRGILADDKGVGKTLPAIRGAQRISGLRLVVVPAYLLPNWEDYLAEEGETNVQVVRGSRAEKLDCLVPNFSDGWVLISYDTLAILEYESLASRIPWDMVIADECHRLRGRNTKRTVMAFRLFPKIPYFWGLTGTPLVSNAGDVYPLLRLCDPVKFSSYWKFVEEHARIEITPWAKVVKGPRNQEQFNAVLRPYMLRRTFAECLPDIPEAVEEVIRVDIAPKSIHKVKLAKEEYLLENPDGIKTRIGAGGLLSAMRQIVNDDGAKTKAMLELIEDIPEEEQIVVFTWHRKLAEDIGDATKGQVITGGTSLVERERIVKSFREGQFRILVATISSVSEGLNLQNARFAIFMEESYLSVDNDQATSRLLRRGQTGTVIKYVINARRTIDERIHKAVQRRASMLDVFDEVWRE